MRVSTEAGRVEGADDARLVHMDGDLRCDVSDSADNFLLDVGPRGQWQRGDRREGVPTAPMVRLHLACTFCHDDHRSLALSVEESSLSAHILRHIDCFAPSDHIYLPAQCYWKVSVPF